MTPYPKEKQLSLVIAQGLTKTYRAGDVEVSAIKGADFVIEPASFVAFVGPSGSGKSTLLNMIGCLDHPTGGKLSVLGTDIATLNRRAAADFRGRNIGFIFQDFNLVPVLTAYENIELPLLLHGLSRRQRHERVRAALDLVDMADRHDHYPRQLSGGQEQRVAIARAIVTEPTLIVADEPTGDLDRESAANIMDLLTRLSKELGRTLIMVTHDAHCASYAGRTVHLEKGRLVEAEQVVAVGAR